MKKPVIVCVDDEPAVLESLKIELKRALGDECIIETAEGGIDALELMRDLQADDCEVALVLSDYIMPDIKGDELLKRIHEVSPKSFKVMLTGQATVEAVSNAIKSARLYRYIAKPWQPDDLKLTVIEALHSYLQDRKLFDQSLKIQTLNQELAKLTAEQEVLIESLTTAEQKYRSIFENALEGIFQRQADGRFISVNPTLARILGYDSPEELLDLLTQSSIEIYVEPERRKELLKLLELNGEISQFESQVYRKDGEKIWIAENERAVYSEAGELLYYQGFIEDITQRKIAEDERTQLIEELSKLNKAYERFVPVQFLELLDKAKITDVQLGDHVEKEMSVLFCDIRNFTRLSELMSPEDNFRFINAFLSRMEPSIWGNHGFVDKYIGDGIMALFTRSPDDAVMAAITMLHRLSIYNTSRERPDRLPLAIGIAINTGTLMLGTIGGEKRMDGSVISDTVNLTFRLEELNKVYGTSILITHNTFMKLNNLEEYCFRLIDRVTVKGKSMPVTVYEIFDGDTPAICEAKLATKPEFEHAVLLFHSAKYKESANLFQTCLVRNPSDRVTQVYLNRCHRMVAEGNTITSTDFVNSNYSNY